MGLDGRGIFQARRHGRWVDVVSAIDPCAAPAIHWLERSGPERGFPADFEVADGAYHPIADDNLRPPHERGRQYREGSPEQGRIFLGDEFHSWLTADELLALADAELAGWRSENRWGNSGAFVDEVNRLGALHGEVRLVFGLVR